MGTVPERPRPGQHRTRLHITDVDLVREGLNRLYHASAVVDTRDRVAWSIEAEALGPLVVVRSRVTGRVRFSAAADDYIISMARSGAVRSSHGGVEGAIAAGRSAMLFSPGAALDWDASPGATPYETLTTQIDHRFLVGQLEAMTGATLHEPLVFAPQLSVEGGTGADVERLLRFFQDEAEREGNLLTSPLVLASLSETVARALLLGLPHSHTHLLARPAPPAAPRAVRLAEAYAEAHALDPLRVADLARVAGTSVRALEAAFRAHRATTPTAFLRERRLAVARRRLLGATAGASVTTIAHDCGFLHLGRFSAEYRARFGETPSTTLRRGLAATGLPADLTRR